MTQKTYTPGLLEVQHWKDGIFIRPVSEGSPAPRIASMVLTERMSGFAEEVWASQPYIDAARVVLTWNSHDALVEALERLLEASEDFESELEAGEEGEGPVEQARDAIALSKGTPREKVECEVCGGDGKETCTNPDHGFIDAMSGETNRLGCPVCGHDPDHKVPDGGDCEECEGLGFTYEPALIAGQEEGT